MRVVRDVLRAGMTVLALTAGIGLAGCQSLREAAGFEKFSPDEFLVATRKPLLMPPDTSLRQPQGGAVQRNVLPPVAEAKEALFAHAFADGTPSAGDVYSSTELLLLNRAGVLAAAPPIRRFAAVDPSSEMLAAASIEPPSRFLLRRALDR